MANIIQTFPTSAGASLPSGGTTGQALVKHSNTDQDVEWATIEGGDSIQVDELPEASVDELGKIYQYVGSHPIDIEYTDDTSNFVGEGDGDNYSIAKNDLQLHSMDSGYGMIKCKTPLINRGTFKITHRGNTGAASYAGMYLGSTMGGSDIYTSPSWNTSTTAVTDEIDLSQFDNEEIYVSFRINVASGNRGFWYITSMHHEAEDAYTKGFFYECKKYPDEIVDRTMAFPEHTTAYTGWDMLPTINIDQTVTLNKSIKNSLYILNGVSSGQLHVDVTSVEVHEGDELGFRIFGSGYVASYKEVVRTYYWDEIPVQEIPPSNETISLEDFNALTQEEKDNGTAYYIYDAEAMSNFTVMGNRFDKANIYTEDERMIGSYLGKPLYQKSAEITLSSLTPNTWIDTGVTIANYEYGRIVSAEVWSSENGFVPLAYTDNGCVKIAANGSLQILNISINWVTKLYVTLQYTKTTDGTVNIGTGNDYSTDEQIIGTWIDGKPVYQKTVSITNPVGGDTLLSNVANLISATGQFIHNDKKYSFPYTDEAGYKCYTFTNTENSNEFKLNMSRFEGITNCTVIMIYTKTTD